MDQQAAPVRSAGPAASLRALASTLGELAATRVELAIVELREETARRRDMLILAGAVGVFAAFGLLFASFLVVAVFWDTHRLAAIAGVAAADFAIAGAALWRLRAKIATSPPPFEATLRELAADRALLAGACADRKPGDE